MWSILRSAVLGAAAALLLGTALDVVSSPASAAQFTNPAAFLSGTAPSGLSWTAVATGTALPIRSSGTNNGAAGAVAYFDTTTGRVQIDPKGWNLQLFNITYTTGTVNTSGTSPGPFQYASGTTPTTAIVSSATGAANQKTLPAGSYTLITCNQARIAGTVSLIQVPTLTTTYDTGNGAANGTSPYSTSPDGTASVAGWFNQPWSFPYVGDAAGTAGLVKSGSLAAMSNANFKTFGVSGNANANILGYGNYQSTFMYVIDGITGNQVGAFIPYASTALPKDLIWNITSGTWNTTATAWTQSGGGSYAFADGDSVTFSGTGGGTVTLSGSLAPSAVTVSATAGTYTFASSAGNQITGTAALAKSGAGTLVLAGPNAYSGGTTLAAGTLRVGDAAALGSGTLALNGGTLASDSATARGLTNPVSVGGDVTFGDGTGTGSLTLSGSVNLGGATRTLTTVADATLSGVVSNGGLTKSGSGTLTLTASNTYSGGTTVSDGELAIGSGGTTGSVVGNIVNDARLRFARSDAVTYSGVISGSGDLYKDGTGTLTLTAQSTFTGKTQVVNGTLALSGSGSIATSPEIVMASATLDVSGVTGGWQLASGQTLFGEGTLVGPATAAVGSTVRPRGETATLTATGGLTLLGVLDIQVNGSLISLLDAAAGALTLGGTLNLDVLSAPTGNLVFAKYQSLAGTFGSITGLPSGYTIDYAYSGNQIALVQSSPPPSGVPEIDPAGLAGVAAFVVGALGLRERRRAACQGARRSTIQPPWSSRR